MVLLRLKGHLESNVRPRLVQLAETLSKRCPALKAVTFHDLRRSNPTSLLASGIATAATFGAAVDTSSRIAALAAAPGAALGAGAATEPRKCFWRCRPHSPDEVLLGSDALLVSVLGRRFRITGELRSCMHVGVSGIHQLHQAD